MRVIGLQFCFTIYFFNVPPECAGVQGKIPDPSDNWFVYFSKYPWAVREGGQRKRAMYHIACVKLELHNSLLVFVSEFLSGRCAKSLEMYLPDSKKGKKGIIHPHRVRMFPNVVIMSSYLPLPTSSKRLLLVHRGAGFRWD